MTSSQTPESNSAADQSATVPDEPAAGRDRVEAQPGETHEYSEGVFGQGHEHPTGEEGQGVFDQGRPEPPEGGQGVFDQGRHEPPEEGQGVYDQDHPDAGHGTTRTGTT